MNKSCAKNSLNDKKLNLNTFVCKTKQFDFRKLFRYSLFEINFMKHIYINILSILGILYSRLIS